MLWLDLLLSAPDAPWSPPKWLPVVIGMGTGNEPSEEELMDAIMEQAGKTPAPYMSLAKPAYEQGKKNVQDYVDTGTSGRHKIDGYLYGSKNGDSSPIDRSKSKGDGDGDGE